MTKKDKYGPIISNREKYWNPTLHQQERTLSLDRISFETSENSTPPWIRTKYWQDKQGRVHRYLPK